MGIERSKETSLAGGTLAIRLPAGLRPDTTPCDGGICHITENPAYGTCVVPKGEGEACEPDDWYFMVGSACAPPLFCIDGACRLSGSSQQCR